MKISDKPPIQNPQSPEAVQEQKLRQLSRQFESMLVRQMVGAMRKTVVKQGLIPESNAERVYQSMLDMEHSQAISESNQLGLSEMVYRQLLRSR